MQSLHFVKSSPAKSFLAAPLRPGGLHHGLSEYQSVSSSAGLELVVSALEQGRLPRLSPQRAQAQVPDDAPDKNCQRREAKAGGKPDALGLRRAQDAPEQGATTVGNEEVRPVHERLKGCLATLRCVTLGVLDADGPHARKGYAMERLDDQHQRGGVPRKRGVGKTAHGKHDVAAGEKARQADMVEDVVHVIEDWELKSAPVAQRGENGTCDAFSLLLKVLRAC